MKNHVTEILEKRINEIVSETNNEATRDKLVDNIVGDLFPFKRMWKVICDERNNPASIIDNNELVCDVVDCTDFPEEARYHAHAKL